VADYTEQLVGQYLIEVQTLADLVDKLKVCIYNVLQKDYFIPLNPNSFFSSAHSHEKNQTLEKKSEQSLDAKKDGLLVNVSQNPNSLLIEGITTSNKPCNEISMSKDTLFQNQVAKLIKKYNLPDASQISLEKGLRNAASNNKIEDLKCFITYVKNLDAKDTNPKMQRTALHWAAIKGNSECYQLLIQAAVDPMISDAVGKTALDYKGCLKSSEHLNQFS
jgi:hypothetical protein